MSETQKLLDKLKVDDAFDKFVSILNEHEQIEKFVKLVKVIASGELAATNLCWKAALDMGALFSCKSTTQMEYDKEWLEFCQVIYHMFGGGVINALRGRGHFSQVTGNKTQKGKFPPSSGEYNFPIPSIPTLKKLNIGFPSEIPVGFVEQSLQLAEERAKTGCEYVLSFDGKLIAPGCKGESNGDSNMWGFEGPLNLSQSVKILKRCLNVANSVAVNMEHVSSEQHYTHLTELLNVSSLWIKRLRNRISGSFYLRKKLIEKCGDNEELKYKHRRQMSRLNQNTSECESVVRCLLEVNIKITEVMAALNNNLDVHVRDNARHITLIEHSNNFQLLPPEIVKMVLDITKEENYQYIKQRTDEWFQIRKESRVTGSTLNKALGLDTLLKQKEHHYVFVHGREEPPVSPELQKMFDYGTRNETNAIATLVSTIVPAYLPACYAFYEVGPCFISGESRKNIIEVSANGILQCSFGDGCPNMHIHGTRWIAVEIKSPFPQPNVPENIYYDIPTRYVPQIQAELKAYNCSELWLVCSTAVSASVIVVNYDNILLESIFAIVEELYGPEKPPLPTCLHRNVKDLRVTIANSKKTHSHFMCEVPTVTGEPDNITLDPHFKSPYSPAPGRINVGSTTHAITEMNTQISQKALGAFKECHQVLRDPGKELLVFMLTDKDRKYDKNVPYSFPVAYALKGSSMTNAHLKCMVDKLRDELKLRHIPVICETYDGQWHKNITEHSSGARLTRLFGRDNWNRISNLTKDKCLEQIISISIVKKSTQTIVSQAALNKGSEICMTEINIERKQNGSLHVWSGTKQMQYVHSITPTSCPDLFKFEEIQENTELSSNEIVTQQTNPDGTCRTLKCTSVFKEFMLPQQQEKKSKHVKRKIGLTENEKSLLDILVTHGFQVEEDIDNANADNYAAREDNITLENYLKSDRTPLLRNILNELQNFNSVKWSDTTIDDLFPDMLTDGDVLMKKTTLKELQIICVELRCISGRNWSSSDMVKHEIVNTIVRGFGGNSFADRPERKRETRKFNPETLLRECTNLIKGSDYPVEHIQVPLASLTQIEMRKEWYENATTPLFGIVPGRNNSAATEHFQYFSYPEFNRERNQLEFKTFDFTHILTNIRTQILTRGLPYCRKEHFEKLCHDRPDILSISLVCEKIDQQNAFTALRMFNYDVEKYMRENSFHDTAKFVKLVREWHEACNKRGLAADDRVHKLYAMHQFLTQGVNFDAIPSQFTGRYIKGLTWQTYEALLQTISTRIQLYCETKTGTYNARAVSTLANESFFADLVRYDKESHGYPKGTNVSRVFGRVVLINHFKHKRDKNYFLSATIKSKYEIKLAEESNEQLMRESLFNHNGIYRNHFFDFPNVLKSQRVRRDDITTGLAALRTTDGVRRWFKTVEADILSEIRGGNKVKGFTLDKNVY